MEKEKIVNIKTTYSVNVAGSMVESLRVNNNLTTTVRVYDEGFIGVAGRIGECDEQELIAESQEKLSQKIPYPCNLTENVQKSVDNVKEIICPNKFVATAKSLIDRLNKTFPDYVFSNKINMTDSYVSYENSKNTKLEYHGNNVMVSLVVQKKGSGNIMDFGLGFMDNRYDEDEYVSDMATLIDNFDKRVEMPEEELPIIIEANFIGTALVEFLAEKYVMGASLFNGKLGTKIFNEKVNIYNDRDPYNKYALEFFDAEGVVPENNRYYFVKDGVFTGLITTKRSSANFNLPLSGSAAAAFDGVPSFSGNGFAVGTTAEKTSDLVKDAIYVCVTSGGDMTPSGDVGLPIMLAYLVRDGKIVGRLPEFSIGGNLSDILGKDFIGIAKCDLFKICSDDMVVAKFKINK